MLEKFNSLPEELKNIANVTNLFKLYLTCLIEIRDAQSYQEKKDNRRRQVSVQEGGQKRD